MVVIDATTLLLLLRPGILGPANAEGVPIERPKERIELLVERLQKAGTKIIVPTPALSEILVRAGADGSQQIVEYLNKYAVFRIEPFDTRAAIELAAMTREAIGRKAKRGSSAATWAKIKFDRQIVAIAKVCGANEIYSDDRDMESIAKLANIKVIGLADLPLPEEDRQGNLHLEGHADGQIVKSPDDGEEKAQAPEAR
jgi:predicted nucleic acid-binding protein